MNTPPGPPPELPATLEHFIGGQPAASADGVTFEVADPVSNQPYATVAAGGAKDVDRAVTAAAAAFADGPWPDLPARARARILNRIADGIEARAARIAELETFDTGLPITQARGQAARAAENFRFFADLAVTLHEDAFRSGTSQFGYVIRRPAGVASLITPWNTPFMLETWKLAPALASGGTVVLKLAEWTPLSASLLPEIMTEAGLPDGVFNLVNGIGEVAGAALVAHPGVPRISFTGETGTGRAIMAAAAPHLKGLSMELGGKSPCVIFADADLDQATDSALFGVFSLNGERCRPAPGFWPNGPSTTPWSPGLPPGPNGSGWATPPTRGPRSARWCTRSTTRGCFPTCRPGWTKAPGWWPAEGALAEHLATGNYLAATVFADVEPSMRIFREEIFGPVVCVTPFGDEAEAVALANATDYGLAAYIWTSDLARAHRVAHAVEAGHNLVNSHNVQDLRTPFGGVKASGLGREGGPHSLDFYTESRIVHIPLGDARVPRFGA